MHLDSHHQELYVTSEQNSQRMPLVIIACQIFQDLLEKYLPPGELSQTTFLDYGLHRVPAQLRRALQEQIDQVQIPSLIVLGYGLCGNGLNGIAAREHILLTPRADDCIAMLLGSYEAYQEEFNASPGTYYLSKGWLESGSNPLQEYRENLKRFQPDVAEFVMDQQYQHYKRLAPPSGS
jgi:hypothetical protein